MHAEDLQNFFHGEVGDIQITQKFLLAFSIAMEIPMLMILLSKVLPNKANRIVQVTAGIIFIIIQVWSLSVGEVTMHYWFFSLIEIGLLVTIVWQAADWKTKSVITKSNPQPTV